jgi:hypothetical protein
MILDGALAIIGGLDGQAIMKSASRAVIREREG